jgi:oxygen-independent coproporphyrinogen-3 oxidase
MEYLNALKQEIAVTIQKHPFQEIDSIFVGGGTPTTLTPEQMEYFLTYLLELFPDKQRTLNFEFTIEANPETVTSELLSIMRMGGVNRLSYGVQTFEPSLLKKLGRMHSPEQVLNSIAMSKQAGFQNISIDLMFGLPGQTVDMLNKAVEKVIELGIPHVSAYSLKVEEGTFYHTLYLKDKLPLPTEEEEVKMYELLMNKLPENGLLQYEISNFGQPGYESKHNLTYWRNQEYYGFGAGAHGYVDGVRHVNAGPVGEYIELVSNVGNPYIETHELLKEEKMEDMMIMGLRIAEGVSQTDFNSRYNLQLNEVYGKELLKLLDHQLLATDGQNYFLTRKGKFLGNEVFATFLKD